MVSTRFAKDACATVAGLSIQGSFSQAPRRGRLHDLPALLDEIVDVCLIYGHTVRLRLAQEGVNNDGDEEI